MTQFDVPPGKRGRYDYGPTYAGKPVDFAPTGLLSLEILETTDLRRNWHDTERRTIEDTIPEFVAMLMKSAVVLHRHSEDRKAEQLERKRVAAERERMASEIKAERDRVENLFAMAENWRRAQALREFLCACKRAATETQELQGQEQFEQWLKWAQNQADRLDPLTASAPSIVDSADDRVGSVFPID